MVVCEYYPPGNVETQYKAQVQRQMKKSGAAGRNEGWAGAGTGMMVAVVLFMAGVMVNLEDCLWR